MSVFLSRPIIPRADCFERLRFVVRALVLDMWIHLSGSFYALVGGMGVQFVFDAALFSDIHRSGVERNRHGLFVAKLCGPVGVRSFAADGVAEVEEKFGG